MSYVNMMDDVRWTDDMHTAEGEREVRQDVPANRETIVIRRMFQMLLPLLAGMLPPVPGSGPDPYASVRAALSSMLSYCAPVTSDQFAEIVAAGAVFTAADAAVTAGRADGDLLNSALDYEADRAALAALPAAPPSGPDPYATQRAALTAQLAAAASNVTTLVAQRDAWRSAQNPPGTPQ